jgi:putative membrane protein
MTATQGDLASLSRFVFRAPSWYSSLAFSLVIAALAGVAAFDSRYVLADAWEGVFFIGVPTVAASALTPWVDRKLGGQLTPNRASLLALVCELLVIAVLLFAGVVALLSSVGQRFVIYALFAALAGIFALRLLVVMAVSHRSPVRASVPASIQTATAAVLLFVYSGTLRFVEAGGPLLRAYLERAEHAPETFVYVYPGDFALLTAMCALYGAAVYAFVAIIDRPWQRSMGISVLDFLRGFVGHIAEGTDELEDFFEQIGEEAVVPVTVLSFRTAAGEKARFVLPMIHPGPMGEIGGGNLPKRVAEDAEGLAFPPHATAGHDFNLVTRSEVERLIDAADRAADRIEYDDTATRSVRSSAGGASVLGQAFGDGALLVASFAPTPTPPPPPPMPPWAPRAAAPPPAPPPPPPTTNSRTTTRPPGASGRSGARPRSPGRRSATTRSWPRLTRRTSQTTSTTRSASRRRQRPGRAASTTCSSRTPTTATTASMARTSATSPPVRSGRST